MNGESVHISFGCCRYEAFESGDPVELSRYGWAHGLAANYAYTVGEVVNFENGILTVKRYGMDAPQHFHPCFWVKGTKESIEALRKIETAEYDTDYIPYANDDLRFDDEGY